jgi:hypothetical protein
MYYSYAPRHMLLYFICSKGDTGIVQDERYQDTEQSCQLPAELRQIMPTFPQSR